MMYLLYRYTYIVHLTLYHLHNSNITFICNNKIMFVNQMKNTGILKFIANNIQFSVSITVSLLQLNYTNVTICKILT